MAEANIKDTLLALEYVSYIYYLIWFKKNELLTLFNLGSKINAIILKYGSKLALKICFINVKA